MKTRRKLLNYGQSGEEISDRIAGDEACIKYTDERIGVVSSLSYTSKKYSYTLTPRYKFAYSRKSRLETLGIWKEGWEESSDQASLINVYSFPVEGDLYLGDDDREILPVKIYNSAFLSELPTELVELFSSKSSIKTINIIRESDSVLIFSSPQIKGAITLDNFKEMISYYPNRIGDMVKPTEDQYDSPLECEVVEGGSDIDTFSLSYIKDGDSYIFGVGDPSTSVWDKRKTWLTDEYLVKTPGLSSNSYEVLEHNTSSYKLEIIVMELIGGKESDGGGIRQADFNEKDENSLAFIRNKIGRHLTYGDNIDEIKDTGIYFVKNRIYGGPYPEHPLPSFAKYSGFILLVTGFQGSGQQIIIQGSKAAWRTFPYYLGEGQYGMSDWVETDLESIGGEISKILALIPAQASPENQLADKDFVNSSVGTNTGTFRGTFETEESLPTDNVFVNDYAFIVQEVEGNPEYSRYKYDGTAWVFEYVLNNSSFTAEQWATLNSGLTQESLDGKLAEKVPIDAVPAGAIYARRYSGSGFQAEYTATDANAYAIVVRDSAGKSKVKTPTDDDDVKTIANVEYVKSKTSGLDEAKTDITDIKNLIPAQASSENQLADKDFVNSTVSTLTASFIGNFNTYADLLAYPGQISNNDYAIVISDETHDNETWRYKYNSSISTWLAEYKVNDTPLTAEQLAALNSGITQQIVNQVSINTGNIAVNTGVLNSLMSDVANKQDLIGAIVDTGWIDSTSYFEATSWSYVGKEITVTPGATYIMQYSIVIAPNTVTQKGDNMIIRSTSDERTGLTFPVNPTEYAQATLTEIIKMPLNKSTATFQLYSSRVYGSGTNPQLTKSIRIKAIKIND